VPETRRGRGARFNLAPRDLATSDRAISTLRGAVLVRQIVQPLVTWYAGSVALVTLMERARAAS
jgi:hypothetical protein